MLDKFIKSQKFQTAVDVIHVIICIVIIVLAVFVFWKPLEHEYCYPLIFLLAAILNFINISVKILDTNQRRKHFFSLCMQILFGIVLLVVTFLSIISIWRN